MFSFLLKTKKKKKTFQLSKQYIDSIKSLQKS